MSQSLNTGTFKLTTATKQQGIARRIVAFLFGVILTIALYCSPSAWAQSDIRIVRNSTGDAVFTVNFYDPSDGVFYGSDISTYVLMEEERQAVMRAVEYWVERLAPENYTNTVAVLNVGTIDVDNAWGAGDLRPPIVSNNPGTGVMALGRMDWVYAPNSQLQDVLGVSMESVTIHEIGHALGINTTYPWSTLCDTTDYYNPLFQGATAIDVYGDVSSGGTARDVPLNHYDIAHFDIFKGLMTHQMYRDYTGFIEVELAGLVDIGYNIDIRNFFGRSYYTSNRGDLINPLEYTDGYFKSNGLVSSVWQGYSTDANTSSFGVGLHVFGDTNVIKVTTNDILADGVGGAGIRIDGSGNTLIIGDDVKVTANGELGAALLVAFGTHAKIIQLGDLEATDATGIAARFDFGYNLMGSPNYNSSTLGGALVDSFDVSGSIEGGAAAIYISNSAHVDTINFLDGATITGDIVSDYTAVGKSTKLTFGKLADGNGAAAVIDNGDGTTTSIGDTNSVQVVNGNIGGSGIFNLETWGGITVLDGTVKIGRGIVGMDSAAQSALVLPGEATFGSLTVNANDELAGDATGELTVTTALTNHGTVQNFESLTANRLANNFLVQNINTLEAEILQNDGFLQNIETLNAKEVTNTGYISNVTTLDATNITNDETGIIYQVTEINVAKNFENGGMLDARGQITVGNQFMNQFTGYVAGDGVIETGTDIAAIGGFINRGTIAAGSIAGTNLGVGTLTIKGDFTNSAGTLVVLIDGANNNVIRIEDGTALINGGKVDVQFGNGGYLVNHRYEFLTAENTILIPNPLDPNTGIPVTMDSLNVVTGLSAGATSNPLFKGKLGYDSGSYWFELLRTHIYSGVGKTDNQRAIGRYIDIAGLYPSADLSAVLMTFDNLRVAPMSAGIQEQRTNPVFYALDQMSGAIYGTETSASFQNTTLLNNQLANVLRREAVGGKTDAKDHLWGMTYGHGGKSEFDGNANSYRQGFAGVMLGLDKTNDKRTRLGLFLASGEGSLSSDLLDRGLSKEIMVGHYFRYDTDRGYLLGNVGLGNHSYDTRRTISFMDRRTTNQHNAFMATGYFEAALRYQGNFGNWYPYLGAQYLGMLRQGFTEGGAGSLNLTADKEDYQSVRPIFGVRFDSVPFRIRQKGTLAFYGNAGWMYEFVSKNRYTEFSARFNDWGSLGGSQTFTVRGNDPNHDWVIGGFGLNYDLNDKFRGFAGYDAYANRRQVLHSANLGFVYQR